MNTELKQQLSEFSESSAELDPVSKTVLQVAVKFPSLPASILAANTQFSEARIQYHLDLLHDRKMVTRVVSGKHIRFICRTAQAGRTCLYDRDLLE